MGMDYRPWEHVDVVRGAIRSISRKHNGIRTLILDFSQFSDLQLACDIADFLYDSRVLRGTVYNRDLTKDVRKEITLPIQDLPVFDWI